ncbi:lipocalin-like domain-containing protein [Nocardia sp. NPDC051030]|uniref:lipocalin-like domain-containing protein n=1 Tax=Nocardia sp. NPDC051030 TaxID=3155162 RepID=UPI00342AC196
MDHDLVGVWQLVEFGAAADNGRGIDGPLGPDPSGFLIYTPDGHVTVSMMRTRPGPGPSYMGYAGRWDVRDGRLTHHIVVASRADWVGTAQERHARLDGDELHVSAEPPGRGSERAVRWRRVRTEV